MRRHPLQLGVGATCVASLGVSALAGRVWVVGAFVTDCLPPSLNRQVSLATVFRNKVVLETGSEVITTYPITLITPVLFSNQRDVLEVCGLLRCINNGWIRLIIGVGFCAWCTSRSFVSWHAVGTRSPPGLVRRCRAMFCHQATKPELSTFCFMTTWMRVRAAPILFFFKSAPF